MICRHVNLWQATCAAFLDGIPDEIWMGKNDHSQSFPGDHGIQFELRDPQRDGYIGEVTPPNTMKSSPAQAPDCE